MTGGGERSRMTLAWRPVRKNTRRLRRDHLPIGLDIDDVAINKKDGMRWSSQPARALLDPSESPMRDEQGKVCYASPLRWTTPSLRRRFGER
jgi:hypothetical protein